MHCMKTGKTLSFVWLRSSELKCGSVVDPSMSGEDRCLSVVPPVVAEVGHRLRLENPVQLLNWLEERHWCCGFDKLGNVSLYRWKYRLL